MKKGKPEAPPSPLMELLRPGALMIPAFVRLPGPGRDALGVRSALLLSQAWYMAKYHDGGWEYSPADWAERTGLSADQVSRSLQALVRSGYLERWQKNRVRLMTYRVASDVLEKALLSLAPKTAESRLCKTAESRLCKTAESRLSLDKKFTSKEVSGRKAAPPVKKVQGRNRAPIAEDGGTVDPKRLGCSLADWLDYALELSTTWGKTRDAKACWDEMESVEWRDGSRRKVVDWQAKARRYLETWRAKGGAEKERRGAASARAGWTAAAGAAAFAEIEAAAAAGNWAAVRSCEGAWRAGDPKQFDFYVSQKRRPEWLPFLAAAASVAA